MPSPWKNLLSLSKGIFQSVTYLDAPKEPPNEEVYFLNKKSTIIH